MRKVTLYVDTGFVGGDFKEVIEVEDDTTDEELENLAENFLAETIEFGFYEGEDEEEEDYDEEEGDEE